MQVSKEEDDEIRFLIEHIGHKQIGEEVSPNTKFRGYAIAKVRRYGGLINYVAMQEDPVYGKKVIFDPKAKTGLITEYIFLYIYDEIVPLKIKPEPSDNEFYQKDLETMTHEEMRFELSMLHKLSEVEIKEYKTLTTRRAKIAEMRQKLKDGTGN